MDWWLDIPRSENSWLPAGEGVFLAGGFWLADNFASLSPIV
jgi:hypothetical protein